MVMKSETGNAAVGVADRSTIASASEARAAYGRARRTWKPQHYLALVGVAFLFYQGWTYVAWLADGPYQITATRDTATTSWHMARVYEALAVIIAIVISVYLVRGCLRARRMTTDTMFCIATASCLWADPLFNFVQPIWFYSSNWVNLNSWCGNMPFVIDKACGRFPQPMIFIGVSYVFGLLVMAMIVNAIMRAARRRWPTISSAKLIALTFPVACAIDIVFEGPMYPLRLWEYPGNPNWLSFFPNSNTKFSFIEIIVAAAFISGFSALRFFRDDRGRTVCERASDPERPGKAGTMLSVLAWIGAMNLAIVWLGNALAIGVGAYSDPYKPQPAHIVNGVCNFPGVTGTEYGPCPGDPDYLAPVRRLPYQ
jgi:hypothetical protein